MWNSGSIHVNLFVISYSSIHLLSATEALIVDCPGGIHLLRKEAFPSLRYFYSVEGDVCPSPLFRLVLCGIMEVLMSTFLQQACRLSG